MATAMLRTALLTCATAGALLFACGEDATTTDRNPSTEDDDDDEKPKRDASTKKDGGKDAGKKDAGAPKDDEDDDQGDDDQGDDDQGDDDQGDDDDTGEPAACTGVGEPCMTASGAMGFARCSGGQLGACTMLPGGGDAGAPAAAGGACPGEFMCTMSPVGGGSFCGMGGRPPSCMATEECTEMLPGSMCMMVPMFGGFCVLTCSANGGGTPTVDAGASGGRDSGLTLPGRDR
jgi:hypothetical protein